ncbi:MAG: S8 family serine peptidase [candidate division Zixibacteria bacterium]|nr:S8 family serine peptidase [candidate division Zixibacteria bacterium]
MSRRLRKIVFFFLLIFFFFRSFIAFGGEVSPDLVLKLNPMRADEFVSCLVVMKDQTNTAGLNFKLNLSEFGSTGQKATRKVRHRMIIRSLMDKAESSQSEIIDYLNKKTIEGSVEKFKTFWITNAIQVTATKDQVEKIASHPDVETIYENYPVTLVEPVSVERSAGNTVERERCLSAISAREAWEMGYTGKGRLVCNFDTGVDGDHPALFSNWRGNNGGLPSASWFDPYGSDFPKDNKGHGTHTMGIMVGISEGDTIGVAFGADWIASAVIDRGASISQTISDILSAFQWAVDPDGNPETLDDVPDVINNSWGIPPGYKPACDQTFWNAIDNVEDAGVVVVFAAGNEGPEPITLRTPADRISSRTNCFSVGAIDALSFGFPVATFSSRGPSGCDNQTIKPEVCAPGVKIYSCYKNGEYRLMSGTSMAAPFVAGAVAILRQYNPDATVEEIKQALLESCSDLGLPGEDNSYGRGLINIKRALDILPRPNMPNLYLTDFYCAGGISPQPGDQINLVVELKNTGEDVDGVFANLSTSDSLAQIASDSTYLGDVDKGEEVSNLSSPFRVGFDQNMPLGRKVEFTLQILGQEPLYSSELSFSITVGSLPPNSLGDHDVGNFVFTLSNFGQYGLGDATFNPLGGKGWVYPRNGKNTLYEAALLIGRSPDQISDGARGEDGKTPQQDFEVLPEGELSIQTPGIVSDQDGFCKFSDRGAENPLGLEISQRSFAYADPVNDDYLVLQYTVKNINPNPVYDFYVGLFFDWDIPLSSPDDDQVGFDSALCLYYQFDPGSEIYLSVVPLFAGTYFSNQIDNAFWLYDGFSDKEKYQFLSGQVPKSIDEELVTDNESKPLDLEKKDWSQIVSCGPFDLALEESTVVAFAIVGGESLDELKANISSAQAKYECMCTGIEAENEDNNLPEHFSLDQNFPNPFNPATTIAFELKPGYQVSNIPFPPRKNDESFMPQMEQILSVYTSLKIYNIRGQLVKTLIEDELPPGRYEVIWDGTDENGKKVASGVYLYRLRTETSQTTRKMILLK